MTAPAGDAQRWEGDRVTRWLRQAAGLDRQFAGVTEALFSAADLQPGERVLDVGCGHGPTTRRAAGEVGPEGRVIGIDISPDMVDAARGIPVPAGAAAVEWVAVDVGGWSAPHLSDVVLSRFGVMFFDDPVVAFTSLAAATASGGRLCAAVWAHRTASSLFEVPYQAAVATLDRLGVAYDPPPVDDGAFSLGDRDHVEGLLRASGWEDLGWQPIDLDVPLGGGIGPEQAAAGSLDLGPSRLVTPTEGPAREAVLDAIAETYRGHVDADGHVVLGASIVVVSARRA